jgi:hypothetical protein
MWKSFIIMEEEASLARKVEKEVETAEPELGNKTKSVNKIIKVLKSKKKEELNQIWVKDRMSMIREVEKFLSKRNLIQQVQIKLVHLQRNVQWSHYKKILDKGLPEYYGKRGNFHPLPEYQQVLISVGENSNKFKGATRMLKGQTIVAILDNDLFLLSQLRNLFETSPTFEEYTELEKVYRRMISFKYPSIEEWECILHLQLQ